MHPLPDQPLPEGWVYIEHPEAGRGAAPVARASLPTWARAGWTEVIDDEPEPPHAPPAPSDAAEATATPRRTRIAPAADAPKEA